MKIARTIAAGMAAAGAFLVLGTVGADDFATIELHQTVPFSWAQLIKGAVMMVPYPVIRWLDNNFVIMRR